MKSYGALLILLFAPLAWADQDVCVLPPPDGAGVVPSPHSLAGVIVEASPSAVEIRAPSGVVYSVLITDATQLFSVYGGDFEAHQLKTGQHAIVWLDDCALPGSYNPAAVLQVCSLAAEPCPG